MPFVQAFLARSAGKKKKGASSPLGTVDQHQRTGSDLEPRDPRAPLALSRWYRKAKQNSSEEKYLGLLRQINRPSGMRFASKSSPADIVWPGLIRMPPLAPGGFHQVLGIPLTFDLNLRRGLFNPGQVDGCQLHVGRREVFNETM
jgi:hypothetical protein